MSAEEPQKAEALSMNQYGFPARWTRRASSKALETLRGVAQIALQQKMEINIDSVVKEIYSDIRNSAIAAKYPAAASLSSGASWRNQGGTAANAERHLKYYAGSPEEKAAILYQYHPKGLLLKNDAGKPVGYLKWELLVPLELWAFVNHGQSFLDIADRGSRSLREIVALEEGVPASRIAVSDNVIFAHLKKAGYLSE